MFYEEGNIFNLENTSLKKKLLKESIKRPIVNECFGPVIRSQHSIILVIQRKRHACNDQRSFLSVLTLRKAPLSRETHALSEAARDLPRLPDSADVYDLWRPHLTPTDCHRLSAALCHRVGG